MEQRLERVLFVHAHPDDETRETGAAIASVTQSGGEAVVATFTLGERGDVRPERQDLVAQVGVGEVRRMELEQALRALGATGRRIHGFEDSGSDGRSPHPNAAGVANGIRLSQADEQVVADALSVVIEDVAPTALVTLDTESGRGHPDQVAVYRATAIAARRFTLPLYVRTAAAGDLAFPLAPVRDRVDEALDAYRSQLSLQDDTVLRVDDSAQRIAAIEHYRLVEPQPSRSTRWVYGAAALFAGALVGMAGTFAHQSVPLGLVLSLTAVGALLAGLRASSASRALTVAALVGMLGVLCFVVIDPLGRGSVGAEGSVIPNNRAGWSWIVGTVVLATLAIAWPSALAIRRLRMARQAANEVIEGRGAEAQNGATS